MDQKEMVAKMNTAIAEVLSVSPDQITPTASITTDLGADSLDAVELSMALEEIFGITIGDDALIDIKIVQDVYNLVAKLLKAAECE